MLKNFRQCTNFKGGVLQILWSNWQKVYIKQKIYSVQNKWNYIISVSEHTLYKWSYFNSVNISEPTIFNTSEPIYFISKYQLYLCKNLLYICKLCLYQWTNLLYFKIVNQPSSFYISEATIYWWTYLASVDSESPVCQWSLLLYQRIYLLYQWTYYILVNLLYIILVNLLYISEPTFVSVNSVNLLYFISVNHPYFIISENLLLLSDNLLYISEHKQMLAVSLVHIKIWYP